MPKPEYMKLFREIVLDTWREKQVEAGEARRKLDRCLRELTERREMLVEAFVYKHAIDQATYEAQKVKLDEEIALARMAAHDAELDEVDLLHVVDGADESEVSPTGFEPVLSA